MSPAFVVPFLFVYGSLRIGSPNPHASFLHSCCRHAGQGRMAGRLFRTGSVYAALHEPGENGSVVGDVFELPHDRTREMLASLDRYEGIGTGLPGPPPFKRELVDVALLDGSSMACWAWTTSRPVTSMRPVPHGDAFKRD